MVLPLVERELRVGSRRVVTYYGRVGVAVVAFLFGGILSLLLSGFVLARTDLFRTFSLLLFVYALLVVNRTADCIIKEKREGTLGFLFLTSLTSRDIILGKLAAAALPVLYGMLATFPLLAILIVYGGVQFWEFVRNCLALLNTVFFAASVGMFFSVTNKEYRPAATAAGFLILALWWGIGILSLGLRRLLPPWANDLLQILNPSYALNHAGPFGPLNPGVYYWLSILWIQAISWWFLYQSWRILPRVWQDRPEEKKRLSSLPPSLPRHSSLPPLPQTRKSGFSLPGKSSVLVRRQRNRALLDINPFTWLVSRKENPQFKVWSFLIFWAGLWHLISLLFAWNTAFSLSLYFSFGLACCAAAIFILKGWIAQEASRQLCEEKLNGTLEWLLVTGMREAEMIEGQFIALRRQFLRPALVLMAATLLLGLGTSLIFSSAALFVWVAVVLLVFVFDSIALAWSAMWSGLKAKELRRSATGAFRFVLLAGGILFLVGSMLYSEWISGRHLAYVSAGIYLAASIAVDWMAIFHSRYCLLNRMRSTAMMHYQGKVGWFEKFGG